MDVFGTGKLLWVPAEGKPSVHDNMDKIGLSTEDPYSYQIHWIMQMSALDDVPYIFLTSFR